MTTLDPTNFAVGLTLSGGNHTATYASGSGWLAAYATGTGISAGKWYWRVKCVAGTNNSLFGTGIGTFSQPLNKWWGDTTAGYGQSSSVLGFNGIGHNSSEVAGSPALAAIGDYMVMAWDVGNALLYGTVMTAAGALNTNWNNSGANPATASGGADVSSIGLPLTLGISLDDVGDSGTFDPDTVIADATLTGFLPVAQAYPHTLYITELSSLGIDASGQNILAPVMPPPAEQTVTIGGSSAASAAFGGTTRFVRIYTDAVCSIAFGTNPTATTANQRIAANEKRLYTVTPAMKVAVITNI